MNKARNTAITIAVVLLLVALFAFSGSSVAAKAGVRAVLGILGLSLVVLVHEAGHYVAARLTGIRVQTFSVGFGRRIWGFTRGETDYRISLVPLGGYCRFYGEEAFRDAIEEKKDYIPAADGEFYGASPWRRIIVSISGPAANVLFAILVYAAINMVGFTEYYLEPKIVLSSEKAADGRLWPADEAGLESGDTLLELNGRPVRTFAEAEAFFAVRPGLPVKVLAERNGRTVLLTLTPELNREYGYSLSGIDPWIEPVVDEVQADSAAERSGLRSGDRILSFNNAEINHFHDVTRERDRMGDAPVILSIRRAGTTVDLELDPEWMGDPRRLGLLWPMKSRPTERHGPFASFARGSSEAFRGLETIALSLRMLFMGIKFQNAVSGPISIIEMTGSSIQSGFSAGIGPGLLQSFGFLSFISLSLAFMNLLPIPVMDGGQIVLFTAEGIRRRSFRPGSVYRYQFVGTIIVIFIFVAASAGDLMRGIARFSGR